MPASTDLLVLGIDAARPELIETWSADGTLPVLGTLRAEGCYGGTHGIDGFFIGSTWHSLCTGVSPARHGIHYMVQLQPDAYRLHRPADADWLRHRPFWHALAAAGRRIAILDVPLNRLDPGLDAEQVVEWGAHDAVFGFDAWPPALRHHITTRYGAHPVGTSCDGVRHDADDHARFIDRLIEGIEAKAGLTRELLAAGDRDFVMQVFTEAHCAGHQLWHLHDATHPAHDVRIVAHTGDPLRRVYQAIDRAIGSILETAGARRVVVLGAHGMGHWYGAQFLLPRILFALGAAQPPADAERRGQAVHGLARALWRRLPRRTRSALAPLRARALGERPPGALPGLGVDLASSRCFVVPNGLAVGGIRLNLAGREPAGLLEPARADVFCSELSEALLEIVDDRTGRRAIREVVRTAERFQGEHLDLLPDLLVHWDDTTPTGSTAVAGGTASRVRLRSPRIGTIEGANTYGRTGEHRRDGFFIAAGAGIPTGPVAGPVSLLDFAPTLAAMLDVPLPGVDGRVRPELAGER